MHPLPSFAVTLSAAALFFSGQVLATTPSGATMPPSRATTASHANHADHADHADHASDFDFLRGHWYVRNKRLPKQLQGSEAWTQSSGTLIGVPMLEGMGNYDELRSDETGPVGVSVRFYNMQTRQWSDYWVSKRDGLLQPAVFGAFDDGVGTFEGTDTLDGKPILVRQLWTGVDTATPRWEQAFSGDGGKTWETNWVMDFSRTPAP